MPGKFVSMTVARPWSTFDISESVLVKLLDKLLTCTVYT